MKRLFSKRQRRILGWIAGGQCQVCGVPLPKNFHADHIIPFTGGAKQLRAMGKHYAPTVI